MKINIRSNIYFPDLPNEIEVVSGASLKDVLSNLFAGTHFEGEVIDKKSGQVIIEDMWEVRVNDVLSHSLPNDLDTEMHDGDTTTFSLMLLGGG